MRKLVLPSASDPRHSVDLFDADLKNEMGDMLCIAPAILPGEADRHWREYVKNCGMAI